MWETAGGSTTAWATEPTAETWPPSHLAPCAYPIAQPPMALRALKHDAKVAARSSKATPRISMARRRSVARPYEVTKVSCPQEVPDTLSAADVATPHGCLLPPEDRAGGEAPEQRREYWLEVGESPVAAQGRRWDGVASRGRLRRRQEREGHCGDSRACMKFEQLTLHDTATAP